MNLKNGRVHNIEEILKARYGIKTQYKKMLGIYVIRTINNCQIYLMKMTLRTHITKEIIPLPRETYELQEAIELEDIFELDDIHELINRAETIQDHEDVDWPQLMITPSWNTTHILYHLNSTQNLKPSQTKD